MERSGRDARASSGHCKPPWQRRWGAAQRMACVKPARVEAATFGKPRAQSIGRLRGACGSAGGIANGRFCSTASGASGPGQLQNSRLRVGRSRWRGRASPAFGAAHCGYATCRRAAASTARRREPPIIARASEPEHALATPAEISKFLAETERRAFKQAMFATRDEDAALDIVQDAMLKLAEKYADKPADRAADAVCAHPAEHHPRPFPPAEGPKHVDHPALGARQRR